MRQPKVRDYLFGHPLVFGSLFLLFFYLCYLAWRGSESWMTAGVVFLFAGASSACGDRVSKYRKWQREMDALQGIDTDEVNRVQRRTLLFSLGCVTYIIAITVYKRSVVAEYRSAAYAVLVFLAFAVVIAALVWLRNRLRALFTRAKPKPKAPTEFIVAQSLPVPKKDATTSDILRALPPHALAILARQRKQPGARAAPAPSTPTRQAQR